MNIQGYIPSRREINLVPPQRSFEELAWGPSIMMAREKENGNTLSAINNGLDFEYFDVDDPTVKPQLDALQAEGDSLASELATKGYNPLLNQKILNYRQKYQKAVGPHGVLGRASKNYTDAMNQWKDWSKTHEKDPQFYKEQVKDKMFSGYKGMWDEGTKSYRGWEPGEVPNYYNLGDDLRDEMAKAKGKLGQIVGSENASINMRSVNGVPMFEVVNKNTGEKLSNSDALTGGLNALSFDYFAPNKNTDRSKFAELMGITPEQFTGMANEVKRSLTEDYYQSLPRSSTSYQNVPQGRVSGKSGVGGTGSVFPTNTINVVDKKVQDEFDSDVKNLEEAFDPITGEYKKTVDKGSPYTTGPGKGHEMYVDIGSYKPYSKNINKEKTWEKYTTEFAPLYKTFKEGNLKINGQPISSENDKAFFEYASRIKQNNASFLNSYSMLGIDDAAKQIERMSWKPADAQLFESVSDGDDKMTLGEAKKKYETYGWEWNTSLPLAVNSGGETVIQIPTGKKEVKEYKIKGLPTDPTLDMSQTMKAVNGIFRDYSWTPEEIQQQNNKFLPISDNLRLRFYISEQDPNMKSMYLEAKLPITDEFGNAVGYSDWTPSNQPTTKSELLQMQTYGIGSILTKHFGK